MSNIYKIWFLGLFLVMVSVSCRKSPEYPTTPVIKFNTLERNIIFDNFAQVYFDSLTFHVDFTDGDGDLGIEENDATVPFTYELDDNGDKVMYDPADPNLPPYSCSRYNLVNNNSGSVDTFLINQNPFYYNFLLKILVKNTNGSFEEVDISNLCPGFNGRFKQLYPDGYKGDLEGTLRYGIKDDYFRYNFENRTVKFMIQIRDNANNFSNIIETEPVTFTY